MKLPTTIQVNTLDRTKKLTIVLNDYTEIYKKNKENKENKSDDNKGGAE